jgi:hypothetical protein
MAQVRALLEWDKKYQWPLQGRNHPRSRHNPLKHAFDEHPMGISRISRWITQCGFGEHFL